MKITLTPQQKLQLEQMHDSDSDGRVRDRIKVVLLASEGWSQSMLDGAAYHRTELVITAAKVLNIEFHYLPLYSPNLNPIERLRKVMNEHVQNNVYFSSKIKFISAIKAFFDSTLPEITDSLMPRTTGSFQLLKPASSS